MRVLLLAALLSATPAFVQAKNPTILIKDPNDPATPITSNTFAFGGNPNGGGYFLFQNVSGENWNTLDVTATLPDLTPITCGPGPFEICTVSEKPVSGGFLYDIFFGPSSIGGVADGATFIVDLNDSIIDTDPNGNGSWPAGADFDANANVAAVPEPATWGLLLSAGTFCCFCIRPFRSGPNRVGAETGSANRQRNRPRGRFRWMNKPVHNVPDLF